MSSKNMYQFGLQASTAAGVAGLYALNYANTNQNGSSEIGLENSSTSTLGQSEEASEPAKGGKKKGKKSFA